jgi:uncharacterized protein
VKTETKPAGYALVTGASRGIGNCFARALAARSWNLILVARTENQLQQLTRELSSTFGIRAEAIAMDLTEGGAAAELRRITLERGLDVELLVNNAGAGDRGEFIKMPVDKQSDMIRLNAAALVELTYHLLPPMIAKQRGAIINISSTAGFQPMPYVAVYAATKAFVTSFSMALAEEVQRHGIIVVTLCPGPTQTESRAEEGSRSKFPGGRQPAEQVVAEALAQLDRRGGLIVPRLINKAMAFSNRLMPLRLSARTVARVTRPRDT